MEINTLIFSIDEQHFAIELAAVERVILAVAVTPVDGLQENIIGLIDLHGEVIPALSMRRCIHLEEREIDIDDQFIICSTERGKAALLVDRVLEITSCSPQNSTPIHPYRGGKRGFASIIKREERLIPLFDIKEFIYSGDAVEICNGGKER